MFINVADTARSSKMWWFMNNKKITLIKLTP